MLGYIERWLPAEGGEPALFHVVHDDGDKEDLEEEEAAQAAQEAAMLPSGHELLGKRVARYFDGPTPTLGTLTKWMCAAHRTAPPAPHAPHVPHRRAPHAPHAPLLADVPEAAAALQPHVLEAARTHMHQRLLPCASRPAARGLPGAREPALFRAVHDDGDQEDLEETEARLP